MMTEQVYTISGLEVTGALSSAKILRALNKDKFGDILNCDRTQDSEVLSYELAEEEEGVAS